ncbi:hypothetical protein EV697_101222 [Bisgaardia hudsonensis]|uniref:Uncharacterized protein n=1 Tax=Bisgaardia hudsonensis TaxID=109472 RepID=A0A4R2N2H4_9PAST|nr:hypothetical protein [Bisgaardia hudsonensis]QLB12553.1 hypothetical protein A6A11_02505 [Bisgaardia hudsonensis]TCP14094.1 hypothetical protein EV697_101222 [Bisgaardia hudsonensis]
MVVKSIRFDEQLQHDIQILADKYNRKPHWIMVESLKRAVSEEIAKLRFIEESEKEVLKMQSIQGYSIEFKDLKNELGLDK